MTDNQELTSTSSRSSPPLLTSSTSPEHGISPPPDLSRRDASSRQDLYAVTTPLITPVTAGSTHPVSDSGPPAPHDASSTLLHWPSTSSMDSRGAIADVPLAQLLSRQPFLDSPQATYTTTDMLPEQPPQTRPRIERIALPLSRPLLATPANQPANSRSTLRAQFPAATAAMLVVHGVRPPLPTPPAQLVSLVPLGRDSARTAMMMSPLQQQRRQVPQAVDRARRSDHPPRSATAGSSGAVRRQRQSARRAPPAPGSATAAAAAAAAAAALPPLQPASPTVPFGAAVPVSGELVQLDSVRVADETELTRLLTAYMHVCSVWPSAFLLHGMLAGDDGHE
jgi:hypothetical protein